MDKLKINKILFVTSEAFPFGMAATARIICLCKGFKVNGIDTQVLTTYKYGMKDDNFLNPSSGEYEGIKFKNVFTTTIKSTFLLRRIIDEYSKFILIFIKCLKIVNKETLIYYYSPELLPAISVKLLSLIKGSLIIKEETEHPLVRVTGKNLFHKFMFMKCHYHLFDGLFVITQNLADYFLKERGYKKPLYILPMVVDLSQFDRNTAGGKNEIVFSGVLDDRKEGLDKIIKAFSKVVFKYPSYTLHIYGRPEKENKMDKYYELISELDVDSKVKFHGYIIHDKLSKVLCRAKILIFARPPSLQADYGFSTKLGEYLATGNPVVATNTGEAGKYLKDRVSVFFCQSNEESIASTMSDIISHYKFALNVGEKGRSVVNENFNNITETRKVLDNIEKLLYPRP